LDAGEDRSRVPDRRPDATVEPVNRYPDFVRNLVRQLKTLFPAMGAVRIADTLARAGLQPSTR
jgi:hypothetical protein